MSAANKSRTPSSINLYIIMMRMMSDEDDENDNGNDEVSYQIANGQFTLRCLMIIIVTATI